MLNRIKTLTRRVLGDRVASYIQAFRIVYTLKQGTFLEPEIEFVRRLLSPGDVIVDVGACGGNWTFPLHDLLGPEGHVFAFEPYSFCARATQIAFSILRLNNVTLFPFGLADRDATAALRLTDRAGSDLLSGNQYIDLDATVDDSGVVGVKLRTLDSLVQEFPRLAKAVLIKCDVEGFELPVFRGAASLLKSARPVVVLEIGEYEKHGYEAADVHRFFSALDYAPFAWLKDGSLGATDGRLEHTAHMSGGNRVLIPREKLGKFTHMLAPASSGLS